MNADQGERKGLPREYSVLLKLRLGRALLILCLLELALLLVLASRWNRTLQLQPYSVATPEPYFAGHPGPWGELEYIRINIELPDDFAAEEEQSRDTTAWLFGDRTRAQAQAFLSACQLPDSVHAALAVCQWTESPDGVVLVPNEELLLGLTAVARAKIYAELAKTPRNDLHAWPFVYRQGGFDAWFNQSGLSAATLALVRQVAYSRGSAVCVSDLPLLMARVADPAERRRLVKTLSRKSTLLMKLRIRPDSDVAALTAYWARGRHVKDIGPLLESLTKIPGGITVDVSHLLPPFARMRVNSYPAPQSAAGPVRDCYWTAFNFFCDEPDPRLAHDPDWPKELAQGYELVETPTFGDLMLLLKPDGEPFHSAVYIADDVVFTKNGVNAKQPWMLMRLEDMLARYPEDYPVRRAFYRPRNLL